MLALTVGVKANAMMAMVVMWSCMSDVLNMTQVIIIDMEWCPDFIRHVDMVQINRMADDAQTICNIEPRAMKFTTQNFDTIKFPHVTVEHVAVPMCPFGVRECSWGRHSTPHSQIGQISMNNLLVITTGPRIALFVTML